MNREQLINLATKSINVTADAINSVVDFTQENLMRQNKKQQQKK